MVGVPSNGFEIPFLPATMAMVREASELIMQNRLIGWGIVIIHDEPLTKGNHYCSKMVCQLPVARGLRPMLHDCATAIVC